LTIVLVIVFSAILAPFIAPHDPTQRDLRARFQPPGWVEGGEWTYVLGTDQLGRDILSRIIYGSRVSVVVGVSAVAISGSLGLLLGLLAGYFGGVVDTITMRVADAFLGIPFIIMVIAVAGIVGGGLFTVIVILGLTGWVAYSRVVRSQTLSIREMEYTHAARAIGQREGKIMLRHILPNVVSAVIILATLEVARTILAESTLSFLGLGVQPPTITWGLMLADGRDHINSAWWMVTFPGLAITVAVLGVVLLGDWVRDTLDPQLRF
jgi:peptide/nickel transport system permease protein